MFSRFVTIVMIAALCVVRAAEGDCNSEPFGEASNGKTAYAGCSGNYNGYQSAVCTDGVYGTPDTTHCSARVVTIFSYGVEAVEYMITEAIPTLTLFTDGALSDFMVEPALPAGLALSQTTGAITGTPTEVVPRASYVITSGDNIVTLAITVSTVVCRKLDSFEQVNNGEISESVTACPVGSEGIAKRTCTNGFFGDLDIASCTIKSPSNLAYIGATSVKRGASLLLTPSYLNTVVSFTVAPTLPAGIAMTTKGTISGVPTGAAVSTTHTVTATGASGTTPTTATVTINVQNADCMGMENDSGIVPTTPHAQNLNLNCPEGYVNTAYRQCSNGIYQDLVEIGCIAKKPTGFTYGSSAYVIITHTYFTTGRPTIQGIAGYYSTKDKLPEGLALDENTGEISGKIEKSLTDEIPIQVSARATSTTMDAYAVSIRVSIKVIDPSCEGTEDFKLTVSGLTASYSCPEGYEGTMKRKCVREGDIAVWGLPDVHCQKVQDFTFLIICIVIFVVCLIVLIIGFAVKSGRSRSKNVKSLKTTPSKTVPKAAKSAAPVAPKPKSTKVAI